MSRGSCQEMGVILRHALSGISRQEIAGDKCIAVAFRPGGVDGVKLPLVEQALAVASLDDLEALGEGVVRAMGRDDF